MSFFFVFPTTRFIRLPCHSVAHLTQSVKVYCRQRKMEKLFELFADVEPIPQDDGPSPPVSIAYPDGWARIHDLFRAMLAVDERSARALALTEAAIGMNPANYTVWQYRRRCLVAIGADLRKELEFLESVAGSNPKNYQIWHHRRAVVELLGDGSSEKKWTAAVFETDAKNYHAWSHRQWAIQRFKLWDGELDYCDQLIREDVRNNSAWNQRCSRVSRNRTISPCLAVAESVQLATAAHLAAVAHLAAIVHLAAVAPSLPPAHCRVARCGRARSSRLQ